MHPHRGAGEDGCRADGQTEHGAGQRHVGREVKIKPRRAVFYSPAEGGVLRPPTRGRPSAQGKIEAKK